MKLPTRIWLSIIIALLFSLSIFTTTQANSAEPPAFTILVTNPPDDLSITLQLPDGSQTRAIELTPEHKAWESYYRVFYHSQTLMGNDIPNDALLLVQSKEKIFEVPLPVATFDKYNNLLTLDIESESLSIGQAPFRQIPLVGMRVILTLLLEGLVFWVFGYRQKRSWIVFLVANLVTQGGLNLLISGPILSGYWVVGSVFGEFVVLVIELIIFSFFIKEFRKRRIIWYAIIANLFSLILGGFLLSYLPV